MQSNKHNNNDNNKILFAQSWSHGYWAAGGGLGYPCSVSLVYLQTWENARENGMKNKNNKINMGKVNIMYWALGVQLLGEKPRDPPPDSQQQ